MKELEKDEETPQKLEVSVKELDYRFPSSSYTVENFEFFPMGPVDPEAPIMKVASKFCGKFGVTKAKVCCSFLFTCIVSL